MVDDASQKQGKKPRKKQRRRSATERAAATDARQRAEFDFFARVATLPGNQRIRPQEAKLFLRVSLRTLASIKKSGELPFHQEKPRGKGKGRVWYLLDQLREYDQKRGVQSGAAETAASAGAPASPLSFGAHMNGASIDSKWPFTVDRGKPLEFFSSIGRKDVPYNAICKWLTLGEFLTARLESARAEKAAVERARLMKGTKAERGPQPSVLGEGSLYRFRRL